MESTVMTPEPSSAAYPAFGLSCFCDGYRDRDEWLEARRSLIGASDTAGIFGVGYSDQSPVTVWDSKINPPREVDVRKQRLFKVGKLMEPSLRAIFAEESGQACHSPGEFTIFRHVDFPWLGATLDAVTEHDEYGPCPVELKNVSNFARDEWDGDEPPLKFSVQVQHQLAVTGASHGFLLGLIGGNEPVIKTIERNERFIEAMLKRLEEFWGYVERKELPPIDSSMATAQILNKLWPEDSGATVVLPPEAARWSAEREYAAAVIKHMEAMKLAAENQIKAAIGDASYGDLSSRADEETLKDISKQLARLAECSAAPLPYRYSWKQQSRAEHIVKASTFRVLRSSK